MTAFLNGGALPAALAGQTWGGIAHASDWYLTLTEGYAGIPVNASQTGGPRPLDGFNLWPAITSLGPSPRNEVISQVRLMWRKDRLYMRVQHRTPYQSLSCRSTTRTSQRGSRSSASGT